MHFTPLSFVDTWELLPSLHRRIGMFPRTGNHRVWHIRRPKSEGSETYVAASESRKWPELKAFLARLQRLGGATPIEFGSIAFELLMPDSIVPWQQSPMSEFGEAQLALRTNPQAMVYAGNESAHLLPGALTVINRAVMRSAVNFGAWPRIHLIVEFRVKQAEVLGRADDANLDQDDSALETEV